MPRRYTAVLSRIRQTGATLALDLFGVGVIALGVGMIYRPAGVIMAGVGLLVAARLSEPEGSVTDGTEPARASR
jgi:hypothetical protein